MTIHDKLLRKELAKQLNKTVIKLHKSYTPDAILIDWEKRQIIAVEAETRSHYYKKYLDGEGETKKDSKERKKFDKVILLLPIAERQFKRYLAYSKVMKLKESFIDREKIGKRFEVSRETVHGWFSEKNKPWAVRLKEQEKENLEFRLVPVKGTQKGAKEILHS